MPLWAWRQQLRGLAPATRPPLGSFARVLVNLTPTGLRRDPSKAAGAFLNPQN